MAHILIIADNQQAIEQIGVALQHEGNQTTAAHNMDDAIRCLRRERFDMLVLGSSDDDLRLCAAVRTDPVLVNMPIICLSAHDDVATRLAFFRAGGDDYIVSPFEPAELTARVRAILYRTQRVDDQHPTRFLAVGGRLAVDPHTHTAQVDGQEVQLTSLEFQLLFKLVCAAGLPCAREQLLDAVWGYAPGTGDPTLLRTQIKNLRHKLSALDDSVEWVQTVPNIGYVVPV